MIIDSHCHSWAHWPYLPPVPDTETHGAVEQLIHQMDTNGVDRATIVCAQIFQNFDNNDYIAAALKKYPDRLEQFADVDSMWSDTYHTPGAAKRLETAAERWPMKAFTHYVAGEDDGSWFNSPEGIDFFNTAEQLGLIASIALGPQHQGSRGGRDEYGSMDPHRRGGRADVRCYNRGRRVHLWSHDGW